MRWKMHNTESLFFFVMRFNKTESKESCCFFFFNIKQIQNEHFNVLCEVRKILIQKIFLKMVLAHGCFTVAVVIWFVLKFVDETK